MEIKFAKTLHKKSAHKLLHDMNRAVIVLTVYQIVLGIRNS
jgi:hypothetical protein